MTNNIKIPVIKICVNAPRLVLADWHWRMLTVQYRPKVKCKYTN